MAAIFEQYTVVYPSRNQVHILWFTVDQSYGIVHIGRELSIRVENNDNDI